MSKIQEAEKELRIFRNRVKKWTKSYILQRMRGEKEISVRVGNLHEDGRVAPRLARELVQEGYLKARHDNKISRYDELDITSKGYDEIQPVEPDLVKIWENSWGGHRISSMKWNAFGVSVEMLTERLPELKYVMENPEQYNLTYTDSRYSEVNGNWTPGVKIEYDYVSYYWGKAFISTPELQAAIADAILSEEIEGQYGDNFAWGLEAMGVFDEKEAAGVRQDFGDPFGRGLDTPEKYQEDIDRRISCAKERIARYSQSLYDLGRLKQGIKMYGGWDKFTEDYREALKKSVLEERALQAEKAEAEKEAYLVEAKMQGKQEGEQSNAGNDDETT